MRLYLTNLQDLNSTPSLENQCLGVLSKDEIERYKKIQIQKKAQQFLFARTLLRLKLAEHINCLPTEIKFTYSSKGKPQVSFPEHSVHFSLSHSGSCILLAIVDSGSSIENVAFGVDLEELKRRNFIQIAEHLFEENEISFLKQITDEQSLEENFYILWTLKESFVKAHEDSIYSSGMRPSFSFQGLNNSKKLLNSLDQQTNFKYASFKFPHGYVFSLASSEELKINNNQLELILLNELFNQSSEKQIHFTNLSSIEICSSF